MARAPSPVVLNAAAAVLRYLARRKTQGATKEELCARALGGEDTVSPQTIQRALVWLRDEKDAPIHFDRSTKRWRLLEPSFSLPLLDPGPSDFEAVLYASALLEPLVDPALLARLNRLVEDMDLKVREGARRRKDGPTMQLRPGALSATVTTGKPANFTMVTKILHAIGRRPLKIRYVSPWAPAEDSGRDHEIEPWQLRIHDGGLYLRAYSITRDAPRSFRVAQIERLSQLPPRTPRVQRPPTPKIWGDQDPAFGVDHDRPGTATVRLRGAVARWAATEQWHKEQRDEWIEPMELLERHVPYRSCRELARRLVSIGDGLASVTPDELADEVRRIAEAAISGLGR